MDDTKNNQKLCRGESQFETLQPVDHKRELLLRERDPEVVRLSQSILMGCLQCYFLIFFHSDTQQ